MGDHPAKNGRSGQGQENDPLVSLCRSHLSPFIDCQWLFYKIESYSSRKNACFSTFYSWEIPCRARVGRRNEYRFGGNSCPGTNAGGTLGGEVRFFEVLRRGSKGRGRISYFKSAPGRRVYLGFSRWLEGVFECRIQLEISRTVFGRSAQSEIGRRSLFRGKTKSGETVCRRYRRYAGQRVGHYFRYQGLCR